MKRSIAVFLGLSSCGSALACGGAGASKPPVSATPASPVSARQELPPLDAAQRETQEELRGIVSHLSGDVGERHMEKSWNLAEATDDLARRLEKMGYEVRRQGFAIGEDVLQNLEAIAPGKEHGDESVVVCAHFDTAKGSPGADDDASGAAAVISLARMFRDRKPSRAVRFALFANGAPPNARTPNAGSLVYAKDLRKQGVHVSAVLNLQGLGYFSDHEQSQKQPAAGETAYPSAGRFVLVASDARSKDLVAKVVRSLSAHSKIPVLADTSAGSFSDDWAFAEVGLPVATVTDTGPLRNPNHGGASDLPGTLDFSSMARVVSGLAEVVDDLSAGD